MKKILSLLLAFTLILPSAALANLEEPQADIEFFEEILDIIQEDYPFEIEESDLIEAGIKGMLQSLDPYSNYYTNEEAEDLFSDINGIFSGIGVYIEKADQYIKVYKTMKGQPAEKAGIKKDDIIISVEDIDIKGMELDKVSSMIKGQEGTTVKIGIRRDNSKLSFKVKRESITVNSVDYEIIEDDIGYIALTTFNSQSTDEMKNALDFFESKKIDKIILDIRDNPGGLFNQAIEISRLFVEKGDIVHQRRNNKALVTHKAYTDSKKYKLVVLVNENSASSSEILAGAIKDRKAGTLVGTKTFGKGIIQSLIPITGGSVVKLTTAEYLTPNKISIHGKGIEPDIMVENTTLDKQLEKAIEMLK